MGLFLNFKECAERLNKNFLKENSLRGKLGVDNGVRLLDLNNDGWMDVVIGNMRNQLTRVWQPKSNDWRETKTPFKIASGRVQQYVNFIDGDVRFGVLSKDNLASAVVNAFAPEGLGTLHKGMWKFNGKKWDEIKTASSEIPETSLGFLRDINNDGICELIDDYQYKDIGAMRGIHHWKERDHSWQRLPHYLPNGVTSVSYTHLTLPTKRKV